MLCRTIRRQSLTSRRVWLSTTSAPPQTPSRALPLLLLTSAVVAPPAFVFYKLNYDPEDKDFSLAVQSNVPQLHDVFLLTKAKVDGQQDRVESKLTIVGDDTGMTKREIESLAIRFSQARVNEARREEDEAVETQTSQVITTLVFKALRHICR